MATWIAHMRIADYFMRKNSNLNNAEFLVGNIGPDCGVPNNDWSSFTPDKNITHWWSEDGSYIDTDNFKNNYLNNSGEKYPFYLGYYFHLLTDIEWSKLLERKMREPVYADGLRENENFIWVIKKDWYGQDHLYLQRNPDCVFFSMFSKIEEFQNIFFDFFPENAFIRQIKYTTNFYLSASESAERDFPFLNAREMDDFVQKTIAAIEAKSITERILQ